MPNSIEIRRDGRATILVLNAPEKRNAVSLEMREAAIVALRECFADEECRVVIITGADGNFSSGGDILAFQGPPNPARTRRNVSLLQELVRLIAGGPKPVVAAVEGVAYGAGMSIAAACDYVVVGAGAQFCASFGKVGLLPDGGAIWSLPQRVGALQAKDILLTARVVAAEEAVDSKLADELAPAGGALAAALRRAQLYEGVAPLAIGVIKSMLARTPAALEQIFAMEADLQPMLAMSEDHNEGRAAFRERRRAVFRGR